MKKLLKLLSGIFIVIVIIAIASINVYLEFFKHPDLTRAQLWRMYWPLFTVEYVVIIIVGVIRIFKNK